MGLTSGLSRPAVQLARKFLLPPPAAFSPEELSHFAEWALLSKIRPEGAREFSFEPFPFQRELYNEERARFRQRVVIMKAAQVGLTVKLLMRGMWLTADTRRQINTGLYFPTSDAVQLLSASRFKPMIRSSAKMLSLVGAVSRVDLIRLGISNMRFLGALSGVSQDSTPLDAELVDEVRLIPTRNLERMMVRVSESTIRDPVNGTRGIVELNSTAGFPEQDIHRFFMDSTQGWWVTLCPDQGCLHSREGINLPREFAANVGNVIGRDASGWYYVRCPRCGARIEDLGKGYYHHENPGAQWLGFHVSQLIKGEGFLNTEIMPAWNRGINIPEFFNSRLGLPYMDPDAVPASLAVVEANMDPTGDYHWPLEPLGYNSEWRVMGVDQRAPEKHVVIKTLMSNGLHRLDHVHVIEASGLSAAQRIVAMARAWGVKLIVIDGEPSYDLAIMVKEGMDNPQTVWFADYADNQAQMLQWKDKRQDKSIKKASGETKHPFILMIDRFKALDWSLGLFKRQNNLLPAKSDFYRRTQKRRMAGEIVDWPAGKEYVEHLGELAKVKITDTQKLDTGERVQKVGEYKQIWRYINQDPHFAHANLYADAGLERIRQEFKTYGVEETPRERPAPEVAGVPEHLRTETLQEEVRQAYRKTCGTCRYLKQDTAGLHCGQEAYLGRRVEVEEGTPACPTHRTNKNELARLKAEKAARKAKGQELPEDDQELD